MKIDRKKILAIACLMAASLLASSIFLPVLAEDTTGGDAIFHVEAQGEGLLIWGLSWVPPYPGEPFYLGGPGPDPPVVPLPFYNWGEPEYSSNLVSSRLILDGVSRAMEDAVRADGEQALPEELTKFWLQYTNSTGSFNAEWVEAGVSGDLVHELIVDLSSVNTGGVWVGPPATCPWNHLALGFVVPKLVGPPPLVFDGTMDGEPVSGGMHLISWPDTLIANLWIDDGAEGTYVNFIWVDPGQYETHEWLTYWLAFEIGVPGFGYGAGEDPLRAWVPPAYVLCREIQVGGVRTVITSPRDWSDDFEDGDYDGWTITGYDFRPFYTDMVTPPLPIPGNYSATDKALLSIGPRVPGLAGVASHPSTIAYGTWSFDIHITGETEEHFYVYFTTDDWDDYPLHINSYDIAIVLQPGQAWSWELEEGAQSGFVLVKRNGAALEGGWQGLGSYSLYEELYGVYHVDITRDQMGNFKVYIDGDLVIEATDTEHTTSTWFRFTGEPGPAIDNVVVRDSIDILGERLGTKVSALEGDVAHLEVQVENLESEKTALESERSVLEGTVGTLQGTVDDLEGSVDALEGLVSEAKSSQSSWQMYAAAALIGGIAMGGIVVYYTKRS